MQQGKLVDSATPTRPFYVNDHGLDSLFSITVVSGSAVLEAGTVLGKRTSDGLYGPYADAGTDGLDTARGILMYRVDPTDGNVTASLMVHGVVLSGLLTGSTTASIADLPLISFN